MATRSDKSLITQAAELAESIMPTIESAVTAAKETALPLLNEAKEATAPLIADGKALAAEKAAATKDLAAAAAAKVAASGAEDSAEESGGGRGWLRKLLLVGGLAAVGALVYKLLRGDSESDNWQSSYVPTPAPAQPDSAPTDSAPPAGSDDAGGATPDEAASDALEEPHPVTTPDHPAEVVEIAEDPDTILDEAEEPVAEAPAEETKP